MSLIISFMVAQIFGFAAAGCILNVALKQMAVSSSLSHFHPFAMTFGLVHVSGISILFYRLFLRWSRATEARLRFGHALVQLIALAFAAIGLSFEFLRDGFHLRSFHSIFGFITVLLFVLQWCLGMAVFVCNVLPSRVETASLKGHFLLGILIFVMAMITMLTAVEKFTSEEYGPNVYKSYVLAGFFYFIYFAIVLTSIAGRSTRTD